MKLRVVAWGVALMLAVGGAAFADPAAPRTLPSLTDEKPAGISEAEARQALDVVNAFVGCIYKQDYEGSFRYVRGIDDPRAAAARLHQGVHDTIAARGFKNLSTCEANLEMIMSAVEAYARAHGWALPPSLEDLLRGTYLTELPRCPAGGRYVYTNTRHAPSVHCGRDAHRDIGIKGDYPSMSASEGLSLGDQALVFDVDVEFSVRSFSTRVAFFQPDFNVLWVLLDEVSALQGDAPHKRGAVIGLSRHDGVWMIDPFLTSQDVPMAFDRVAWRSETAIPKQVLYGMLQTQPGLRADDAERGRAFLLLRVCESNLRNLSVALEAVSVAQGGRYPVTAPLEKVLATRMKSLPHCPAGGTYRYRADPSGDRYVIYCSGHAHAEADVPVDLPAVDPVLGVFHAPQ